MTYQGISRRAIAAAREYIGYILKNEAVDIEEITAIYSVSPRRVGFALRRILRTEDINLPSPSVKAWIQRLSQELGIKPEITKLAVEIYEKTRRSSSGKCVRGTAGAAIYIAVDLIRFSDEDRAVLRENGIREVDDPEQRFITQREIAEAARITEVLVRHRYRDMIEWLKRGQS